MIWECPICKKQYDQFGECKGIDCWRHLRPAFIKENTKILCEIADALSYRINEVCVLLGYDADYFEFNGTYIDISYTESRRCNCCYPETFSKSFPYSYLHMSDEEIKETEAGKKAEAERREAEGKKKLQIAQAKAQVKKAESEIATAKDKAEKNLEQAKRNLARLERD